LKRKSKQVLKFEKCAWKGQARINCWTKNENKSQVRNQQDTRQKSALRSPKDSIYANKAPKEQVNSKSKTPRTRKSDMNEINATTNNAQHQKMSSL